MARSYYQSSVQGGSLDHAVKAVEAVLTPANTGKQVCVGANGFEAKPAPELPGKLEELATEANAGKPVVLTKGGVAAGEFPKAENPLADLATAENAGKVFMVGETGGVAAGEFPKAENPLADLATAENAGYLLGIGKDGKITTVYNDIAGAMTVENAGKLLYIYGDGWHGFSLGAKDDPIAGVLKEEYEGSPLAVVRDRPYGPLKLGPGIAAGAMAHNCVVRGKNLGYRLTEEQAEAITSGFFDGLCLGDYWQPSDGTIWRIHGFDYFWQAGHPQHRVGHSIIVVPDTSLYSGKINATATTAGGWVAMDMYKSGLADALTQAQAVFGDYVLTVPQYLTNTVTNGVPSKAGWYTSNVSLMTEEMIFGCSILRPVSSGATSGGNVRVEAFQLPLLRFAPEFARTGESYWLRDISGTERFCRVYLTGTASDAVVTESNGVRPYFVIGGKIPSWTTASTQYIETSESRYTFTAAAKAGDVVLAVFVTSEYASCYGDGSNYYTCQQMEQSGAYMYFCWQRADADGNLEFPVRQYDETAGKSLGIWCTMLIFSGVHGIRVPDEYSSEYPSDLYTSTAANYVYRDHDKKSLRVWACCADNRALGSDGTALYPWKSSGLQPICAKGSEFFTVFVQADPTQTSTKLTVGKTWRDKTTFLTAYAEVIL